MWALSKTALTASSIGKGGYNSLVMRTGLEFRGLAMPESGRLKSNPARFSPAAICLTHSAPDNIEVHPDAVRLHVVGKRLLTPVNDIDQLLAGIQCSFGVWGVGKMRELPLRNQAPNLD
jgi:hypothetical protein